MSTDHKSGLSWGISAGIFIVGMAFYYGMPEDAKEHIFRKGSESVETQVADFVNRSEVSCGFAHEAIGRFPASAVPTNGCSTSIISLLAEGEFAKSKKRLETTLELIKKPKEISEKIYKIFSNPKHIEAWTIELVMDNGSIQKFPAFRVQHNNLLGPTKGGIRFGMDVNASEVSALAMGMTYKAPLGGLPLGGGKGGVQVNVRELSDKEVARLARAYFDHLSRKGLIGPDIDVPAPDMNTGPDIMELMLDQHLKVQFELGEIKDASLITRFNSITRRALGDEKNTPFVDEYIRWAKEENKIAPLLGTITGKAVGRGGSLGRNEATGLGVYYVAREFSKFKWGVKDPEAPMKGIKLAVQGFGNVASHAAKYSHEQGGATINRVVDWANPSKDWTESGLEYIVINARDPNKGLPIDEMYAYQAANRTLEGFEHPDAVITRTTEEGAVKEFVSADVDMLIPAAAGDQITEKNYELIKKGVVIVEGANNPTTPEAERLLRNREVTVVPDSLANAGGVIVSYFEMLQNSSRRLDDFWSQEKVFAELEEKLVSAFDEVLRTLQANPGFTWRNAGQEVSLRPFFRAEGS